MSITVSYRRISPEKFAEIEANPELAEEFFYGEAFDPEELMARMNQAQLQNDAELMQQIALQAQGELYQDRISIYDPRSESASKTQLSIEKEWQAIHYLLTGEIEFDESQVAPPLSNLVLGGTPTQFEATYGYVRYLSPEEVKEMNQALQQVSRDELRARFNARGNQEIYAQEDEWGEESWEFLLGVKETTTRFFEEASANDQMILISSN
jgi:Domain of unknown function (DUF1877)